MSKLLRLLALVALLVLFFALPAFAQEVVETPAIPVSGSGDGEALADAILTIVGFSGLSVLLNKIVERLVKWFGFLKGDLITVAAVLVGWLLAYLFAIDPATAIAEAVGRPLIDGIPQFALYLISGFLLAIGAGKLADREELKYGSQAGAQSKLDV